MAEEFEAMLRSGTANGRRKGFYDIWMMTQRIAFDHANLLGPSSDLLRRKELRAWRRSAEKSAFASFLPLFDSPTNGIIKSAPVPHKQRAVRVAEL